jgi:hypothetical protein
MLEWMFGHNQGSCMSRWGMFCAHCSVDTAVRPALESVVMPLCAWCWVPAWYTLSTTVVGCIWICSMHAGAWQRRCEVRWLGVQVCPPLLHLSVSGVVAGIIHRVLVTMWQKCAALCCHGIHVCMRPVHAQFVVHESSVVQEIGKSCKGCGCEQLCKERCIE